MLRRLIHRRKPPRDPKPHTVKVTATDGQYHTFKLGPGDAVGYDGIRVDVRDHGTIDISQYRDQ